MKGEYDMITIEQVDKLKKRANISYEDAKAALEATEGDLLEAVIYLEREGKIKAPGVRSYHTDGGAFQDEEDKHGHYYDKGHRGDKGKRRHHGSGYGYDNHDRYERRGPTINQQLHYFWKKFCELVKKTNANQFEISRDGAGLLSMPVTLLIVSLVCFFWVTLPLMVIALFLGYRFRFAGPDFGKDTINSVMDHAADAAENIRRSMMEHEGQGPDGEDGGYPDEE